MLIKDINNFKKTKIVATIGPASESEEKLEEIIAAGLNVARLNFSHGTQEDHEIRIERIRKISHKLGKPVAILQDLQGPKIRLGNLKVDSQILKKGEKLTLSHGKEQKSEALPVQVDIFPYLKVGDAILINDGLVRLTVDKLTDGVATCTVVAGGEIKPHKGVNLPNTQLPSMALTDKDKSDLAFGLSQGVDYVAVSFVQSEKDIEFVRGLMKDAKYQPKIIAKIECGPAVRNLHAVIDSADGVMVARGDMAVEVGQEDVPIIQRQIIKYAKQVHKPVIVATQMLESMIHNAEPTRAEVNDVATAVLDQVDAVMLSAESAHGDYPVESVAMMKRIILKVEESVLKMHEERAVNLPQEPTPVDKIAASASILSQQLKARVTVVVTKSGNTAQALSSHRSLVPVFAITDEETTYRRLALLWGVRCFFVEKITDNQKACKDVTKQLLSENLLKKDDVLVFVSGTNPGVSGHINSITVVIV